MKRYDKDMSAMFGCTEAEHEKHKSRYLLSSDYWVKEQCKKAYPKLRMLTSNFSTEKVSVDVQFKECKTAFLRKIVSDCPRQISSILVSLFGILFQRWWKC